MKINRLRLAVELEDGTEHELTVANPSHIAWDLTRVKRKWPEAGDAPMFWQTFLAWHGLHRAGLYAGTFDTFKDEDCAALQLVNEAGEPMTEDEEPEAVDPTPGEAGSDSATS